MLSGPPGRCTMNRLAALLVTATLLVVGVAGVAALPIPNASGNAVQAQVDASGQNGTAEQASPGARLSGVVAVQGAEVEGEVERRTFGIRVARANSNATKAGMVADQVEDLRQRRAVIEERRRALVEARQNGSISQARFEAEIATLAVQNGVVRAQLNQSAAVSAGLPDDVLAAKGVNVTAIRTLRDEARDTPTNSIAGIARSIAGNDVGGGLSAAGNVTVRGPPDGSNGPKFPIESETETATDGDGEADPTETTEVGPPGVDDPDFPTITPGTVTMPDLPDNVTDVSPGAGSGIVPGSLVGWT